MQDANLDQSIEHEARLSHTDNRGPFGIDTKGLIEGKDLVPRQEQCLNALHTYIDHNLQDSESALILELKQYCKDQLILQSQFWDTPTLVLRNLLVQILSSESELETFVRRIDLRWGQLYQERPFFQAHGQTAHSKDPYTFESVRNSIENLLCEIDK